MVSSVSANLNLSVLQAFWTAIVIMAADLLINRGIFRQVLMHIACTKIIQGRMRKDSQCLLHLWHRMPAIFPLTSVRFLNGPHLQVLMQCYFKFFPERMRVHYPQFHMALGYLNLCTD